MRGVPGLPAGEGAGDDGHRFCRGSVGAEEAAAGEHFDAEDLEQSRADPDLREDRGARSETPARGEFDAAHRVGEGVGVGDPEDAGHRSQPGRGLLERRRPLFVPRRPGLAGEVHGELGQTLRGETAESAQEVESAEAEGEGDDQERGGGQGAEGQVRGSEQAGAGGERVPTHQARRVAEGAEDRRRLGEGHREDRESQARADGGRRELPGLGEEQRSGDPAGDEEQPGGQQAGRRGDEEGAEGDPGQGGAQFILPGGAERAAGDRGDALRQHLRQAEGGHADGGGQRQEQGAEEEEVERRADAGGDHLRQAGDADPFVRPEFAAVSEDRGEFRGGGGRGGAGSEAAEEALGRAAVRPGGFPVGRRDPGGGVRVREEEIARHHAGDRGRDGVQREFRDRDLRGAAESAPQAVAEEHRRGALRGGGVVLGEERRAEGRADAEGGEEAGMGADDAERPAGLAADGGPGFAPGSEIADQRGVLAEERRLVDRDQVAETGGDARVVRVAFDFESDDRGGVRVGQGAGEDRFPDGDDGLPGGHRPGEDRGGHGRPTEGAGEAATGGRQRGERLGAEGCRHGTSVWERRYGSLG